MAYVMESEGLVDRAFLAQYTRGYDDYRSYVLGEEDDIPKDPQWVEEQTGVPADIVRKLGCDYGSIKPAALLPGWGPQRTLYGEQAARAMITLACMSGNVGIRGGGLASTGTRSNAIPIRRLPHGPYRPTRHISAVTWAQEILGGELRPAVAMACIVGSNLINRSPDVRANVRALGRVDFVVVNEAYLTPTARHADIVLPICTELERVDLVTSWGHDAHLFYSQQAVAPAGEARTDYWVFAQLAERLGFGRDYTRGKTELEWVTEFAGASHLDTASLQHQGIMRTDDELRVALEDYRADPVTHPLRTPSGKIEISCAQAAAYGLPSVPSYVGEVADGERAYPLQLITPHSKLRSNSCLHASPWLRRLELHAVWINTRDASVRGIAQGDRVQVFNERGIICLPAKVTERIMPGVVCVYQGTWYQPGPDGVDDGGCANVLTSHRTSPTGGCATHSDWVQVRR
jgi:anaerobic dimethyl sulfoxide reductase subunit A